jgi:hypothetical protein
MRRRYLYLVVCIVIFSSCSLQPIQPWDRDILAQKKMRPAVSTVENYIDEHIYFSKEGSSGGQGIGGGGCGCN